MASNLNYKQVSNVKRRTWDVEAYEQKARAREAAEAAAAEDSGRRKMTGDDAAIRRAPRDNEQEEFTPAQAGAAGPEGSKRAFLKPRCQKVDIDSKVGTNEIVSVEAASAISTGKDRDAKPQDESVVKTGIGWHCNVCDCFLKDSLTYLDHINGRKHQRKLGYSMRVERSTKDQLLNCLSRLAEDKKKQEAKKDLFVDDSAVDTKYDDVVKEKDEALQRRLEERKKRRKDRKLQLAEKTQEEEEKLVPKVKEEDEEEEEEVGGMDPALAVMMGFSGFGGSRRT